MKKTIWLTAIIGLLLLCPASVCASSGDAFFAPYTPKLVKTVKKNPRILMVGNSLTFFNKMPSMLKKICQASGSHPTIESYAVSGQKLSQWAKPQSTSGKRRTEAQKLIKALKTKKWDYVVLQEHTEGAVTGWKSMKSAVATLAPLIKKSGAQIVFYQTWAPQKGYSFYKHNAKRVANVADFQKQVINRYDQLADAYHGAVAPAGVAFRRAEVILPSVKLYQADKKHPSKAGSYLAACTLYATMFKQKPAGTVSGVKSAVAKQLQELAADVTIRASRQNNATVKFAENSCTIKKKASKTLTYEISQKSANTRVVSWTSSNTKVATVSSKGVVKAKSRGTANIIVKLNNGKSAKCTVVVTK